VTKVETSIHVGVRKGAEPFWVLLLELLHRLIRFKEFCVRRYTLWQGGRIGVEELTLLPVFLDLVLNVDEIVPLVGLRRACQQLVKCTY